jgi:hypothetical protein
LRKTPALAVALAVMLALLCGVLTFSKKASAQVSDPGGAPSSTQNIDPTIVSGNTSCTALGYAYGYKIDNAPFYRTNVGDGAIRVTTTGSGGQYFDWTSNIGVDAVIVKGGPNSDAFVYDPGKGEVTLDTGLHAPTNPNGSGPFGISHIEFCYDLELEAAKTAEGSFDRTISWALQKNVDPASYSGQAGQDAGSSE